jgi:hypothetical protein
MFFFSSKLFWLWFRNSWIFVVIIKGETLEEEGTDDIQKFLLWQSYDHFYGRGALATKMLPEKYRFAFQKHTPTQIVNVFTAGVHKLQKCYLKSTYLPSNNAPPLAK